MNNNFETAIRPHLSDKAALLTNEPLAPVTSFNIGGPAEYLLLPAENEDVSAAVLAAQVAGIEWRLLGSGSNILIPDEGLPGLTIKFWHQFSSLEIDSPRITAKSGCDMLTLSREAAAVSLSGLEWACGIPGTVGGAVFMNAGVKAEEICNTLESGTVLIENGNVEHWKQSDFHFNYRTSRLQKERGVLLSATFLLEENDQKEIYVNMNKHLSMRSNTQPIHYPNCGSVFRNPEGDFAGRLIEACGLKGFQVGGVQVSEQHANFIVNIGGGTAQNVIDMITKIKQTVLLQTGVELREEVRTIQ